MTTSDTAILVASCDRYSDLWGPFFGVLAKRWPDCPLPIHLGANHKTCSAEGVTTICIGDDETWAIGVRRMLEGIDATRVILLLEDFLLTGPVDTARVIELAELAAERKLTCLRLAPMPAPTEPLADLPGLGVIPPGSPYRISTQAAIWDKAALLDLLKEPFSAWDFERIGTILSDRLAGEGIWGSYEPVIPYHHGVERGKWMKVGLDICREVGVEVDLAARGRMNFVEAAVSRLRFVGFHLARLLVPASLRRKLLIRARRELIDSLLADAP